MTNIIVALYLNDSLYLERKYAPIFVHEHCSFQDANSSPRAKVEENCEIWGTDNVQGQICEDTFVQNKVYEQK